MLLHLSFVAVVFLGNGSRTQRQIGLGFVADYASSTHPSLRAAHQGNIQNKPTLISFFDVANHLFNLPFDADRAGSGRGCYVLYYIIIRAAFPFPQLQFCCQVHPY